MSQVSKDNSPHMSGPTSRVVMADHEKGRGVRKHPAGVLMWRRVMAGYQHKPT